MSSQESEVVVRLLHELSVLKELDSDSQTNTRSETEQRLNQQRQKEIMDQIKGLALQKKDDRAANVSAELALEGSEA